MRELLRESLDHYGTVLLLLIISYILAMLPSNQLLMQLIELLIFGLTLVLILRITQARRIWQIFGLSFMLLSIILALASFFFATDRLSRVLLSSLGMLLLLVSPGLILRQIARASVVTTQTLLGAVCVYVLFGMVSALMYGIIGYWGTAPFFEGTTHARTGDYLFFSFTTLTTVGYGNLVPVNNLGRALAMMEAVTGQVYLVIVVARLVSLWQIKEPPSH